MRLLACAAYVAALGVSGAAIAQGQPSADELVAKNLAARGGADALAALKSVKFTGKLIFPGDFQLAYDETRAHEPQGDATRVNASLQGLTLVQAYDGANGWRINPFQGRRDAEKMTEDEARSIADQALIDGVLLSAKKQGAKVAYLGREDFDGTLGYKLKVSQPDGDEFVYLLDPDTFLEIKMTETRRLRGAQQVTEYELGDYEKVGGVYFPMSVDSWQQGQSNQRQRVIIASAEANVPAPASLFTQPADAPKPVLPGPTDKNLKPRDKNEKPADSDVPNPSKPKAD
ncbi:hypothetical protein SCH01S_10_00180 [Sphingomonas changbaiensis NBRC 104936]|uniref:Outer membrane lipoprotein-sorting protein n=1 Tax=Sphingomonas changbaiensis NBRC 104936 TaxID=1219043 RepID=A0A0E9ML22_9SPHN|nr:hypothetical protein [Sphingomonas changbaiensis]GAO38208.1 hypothetical protein SCH01S_10_00180 [Sphingomonas changbaiensis NBRC 104936]